MPPDPHSRVSHVIEIRFYAELNDFLSPQRQQRAFNYAFHGTPSVKDTIEAIGVPHTEVDVILVDGCSVGFEHLLQGGERVAVYPVFERYDVSPLTRLRPAPLRITRFVADVHLGLLARHLRLLGFDTAWERDLDDEAIVKIACDEQRIILTRDKGILKNGRVTHGYWLRNTDPIRQLEEVIRAIDLGRNIEPYTRCMECNGVLRQADRSAVAHSVPLQVFLVYRDFRQCRRCHRVYWRGSHLKRLDKIVERARNVAPRQP
ncbi:MAG: Mut7-C ubiquitin/RNAse domain-containing protein [Gammaproteobacteria bacterium]|nr:Mut7-C ubiquitin/RNAse domain-containing protein [Gammaproteobacteria bacterium]MDH3362415.1 Mut7-C ubiquitin/RNAse domain-containing protein [Gammaproteobacteria bacterium]MDH3481421.1 Mut7-C ubiquitin/RNAse domain-containing protein [Gammaproteobacteria bacterium]